MAKFKFNPITGKLDLIGDGSEGIDGATWLNGSGAPDAGDGNTGDFYLDNDTGDYYKKTNSTTWTLQGNLKGPPGEAFINVDGGAPDSNYGGIDPIDGGGV